LIQVGVRMIRVTGVLSVIVGKIKLQLTRVSQLLKQQDLLNFFWRIMGHAPQDMLPIPQKRLDASRVVSQPDHRQEVSKGVYGAGRGVDTVVLIDKEQALPALEHCS